MHHSAGHPKHSFYITILPGTCCKCFLEFQSTFCRPTVDYFLLCHGCVCVSPLHGWLSFDKSCEIHDHGVPSNWVRRNMGRKPFCKWEFSVGNPFVSKVDRTPGRALATGQPGWLMEANKTSNQGFTRAHLAKVPSNHHPLVGHLWLCPDYKSQVVHFCFCLSYCLFFQAKLRLAEKTWWYVVYVVG